MTSEEYYREHLHPHVLPVDAEGSDVIPLEDYDYSAEWADLAEQAGVDRGRGIATDGGQDVEDVHEFRCPRCGTYQTGRPDECAECDAPYEW